MYRKLLAATLLLTLTALAGCGGKRPAAPAQSPTAPQPQAQAQTQQSSGPKRGGTLIIASEIDPPGFDPVTNTAIVSWQVFQLAYETLLNQDEKGNLSAGLAERWEPSADGMTYTFHLRKGVKFHNGEELTADDVKYTFDRLDRLGIPYMKDKFKMLKSVEVADRYTVRFVLKEKHAAFLSYLSDDFAAASAIVSKKAGAELKDDFNKTMVGTGPFKFVEYVPKDHITLARHADYWGKDVPYVDQLIIRLMPDAASQLAALRAGQVHLIFPKAETARVIEKEKNLAMQRFVSDWHDGLHLNTQRKPWDNLKVRQAVMLALDRDQIIAASVLGEGVATGAMTPNHPWHVPAGQLPHYKRDVARAKQLLAEAGFPNGFSAQLLASTSYPFNVRQAEVIQQQAAEIGIKFTIEKAEWAIVNRRTNTGDYEAAVYAFLSYPDPEFYLLPRTGRVGPPPAEMADLFKQGASTMDLDPRKEIYKKLQIMTAEIGYPVIWLVAQNGFVAHQPFVKGFTPRFTLSWRPLLRTWIDK